MGAVTPITSVMKVARYGARGSSAKIVSRLSLCWQRGYRNRLNHSHYRYSIKRGADEAAILRETAEAHLRPNYCVLSIRAKKAEAIAAPK